MGSGAGDIVEIGTLGMVDPNAAGEDAADAAMQSAALQAQSQREALDYLKKKEKLPMELRDLSLKGLGGVFGLPGYEDTLDLVGKAEGSPIYKAMLERINQSLEMGQGQAGRDASVGGFLRSGVLADALAKQQAQAGVQRAGALSDVYQQYLGGVQGMANLPSNTNAIANQMSAIGQTQAQGIVGAEQARQQGYQNTTNTLFGLGGLGLAAFSDIRLKENIRYVGEVGRHRWYEWEWNSEAEKLGLKGTGGGVMAHEVEKYAPDAISESNGYMMVDYGMLRYS